GGGVRHCPAALMPAPRAPATPAGAGSDPPPEKVIAGAPPAEGRALADARTLLTSGAVKQPARLGENTTLGVVATNATLTKTQLTKVAEMAHDGFARAIFPSHTMGDGDTIFALATDAQSAPADVSRVGALAAQVVADAIVRAARQATSIPGYPAARDL